MAIRTHLAKQEEGQTESGVQVRAADPGSPASNQLWINTTTLQLMLRSGSSNIALNAPAVTGTRGSPQAITAISGIAFTGAQGQNIWFIQGSGGAVTVTANPQVAVGAYVGQRLKLVGRSDTNTVTLSNGTGLSLNGNITMGADSSLSLEWDGTNWREDGRNDL